MEWEWPIQVLGPWEWEEEAPPADIAEYENPSSHPSLLLWWYIHEGNIDNMRTHFAFMIGSHLKHEIFFHTLIGQAWGKQLHLELRALKADVFSFMKFYLPSSLILPLPTPLLTRYKKEREFISRWVAYLDKILESLDTLHLMARKLNNVILASSPLSRVTME